MNALLRLLKPIGLLLLICFSISGRSQTSEISIRFIGNCGIHLTDGVSNFYIDFPYKSGAHSYMEYDLSELDRIANQPIFIYTHRHSDHYSGNLVKHAAKKLGGRVYTPRNVKELLKLNDELTDFKIEAFKTKHIFSFDHYSYLITWHGKKIFISGDTEHAETIGLLKDIDWAFIPAWLVVDAQEKGIKLAAISKKIAIYHIGPLDKINITGDNVIMLDKQGESIKIPY